MGLWKKEEMDVLGDWECNGELEGGAAEGGLFDDESGPEGSAGFENGGDGH